MKTDLDFSTARAVHGDQLLGGTGALSRAAWVAERIGSNDIFFLQDGALSQLFFAEVLESFVSGQFIATIVLGFSLIERQIAGRLAFAGDTAASKGKSKDLLYVALEKKWLTVEENEHLNELRELRNPVAHFRDHLSTSRPEVKAAILGRATAQLLENDAKRMLEATINFLKKTSL